MAASILRVGRESAFKCLQLERCGILRSCSAVSFCSQTGEPEKPVKKTKASKKTDAPNERAALLVYKTTVAFPIRLSEPVFFPAQSVGEAKPVVSSTAAEKIVASELPTTAAGQSVAEVPTGTSDAATHVVDTAHQTVDPLAKTSRKSSAPDNTPVIVAAQDGTVPVSPSSSESRDVAADLSSSSSSSDSDSDSDSDTEDDKSHVKTETSMSQPIIEEPTVKEEVHICNITEVIKDTNEVHWEPESGVEAVQEATAPSEEKNEADTIIETKMACAEAACEAQHDPVDNILDPGEAPAAVENLTEGPPAEAAPEAAEAAPEPAEAAPEPAEAAKVAPEAAEAAPEPAEAAKVVPEAAEAAPEPAEAAEVAPEPAEAAEVAPEPAEVAPEPAEAAPEAAEAAPEAAEAAPEPTGTKDFTEAITETAAAAEVTSPASSAEVLVDAAPVITDAGGEDLQTAGPIDQSKEAAPEPEEAFDNSTYKNYQHHSYNPYTFADLDMEMAKFRLPQPSSGRPSPRH